MANIELWFDNPRAEDRYPVGIYAKVRIERAPDSSGVPGAFSQVAVIAINNREEATPYIDTVGDSLSWYRHRWSDSNDANPSDYSDAMQVQDSLVKQRAIQDLRDATDITSGMWNDWIRQSVESLYEDGIWWWWRETITPTLLSDGSPADYYDLPYTIRDAFWLEKVDPTTLRHISWQFLNTEWTALGGAGQLRIYNADTNAKYVVHGKRQYRNLGELTDDYWLLISEKVRLKYLKFRADQLAHTRKFVFLDKRIEVNPPDLDKMIARVDGNIAAKVRALVLEEPALMVAVAGWGTG